MNVTNNEYKGTNHLRNILYFVFLFVEYFSILFVFLSFSRKATWRRRFILKNYKNMLNFQSNYNIIPMKFFFDLPLSWELAPPMWSSTKCERLILEIRSAVVRHRAAQHVIRSITLRFMLTRISKYQLKFRSVPRDSGSASLILLERSNIHFTCEYTPTPWLLYTIITYRTSIIAPYNGSL
jgi:hypothetical protein